MSLPVGSPGVGADGIDPTPEELEKIVNLTMALAWPGITDPLRDGLYAVIGTPTVLRDIAFIPRVTWD